jgi:hypothetical protein
MLIPLLSAGAAERSDEEGVGVLFLAHRGAGAYSTGLWGDARQLTRIHVKDTHQLEEARFMESYESRHSNHSFTAQVVGGSSRKGNWSLERGQGLRSFRHRWCLFAGGGHAYSTMDLWTSCASRAWTVQGQ